LEVLRITFSGWLSDLFDFRVHIQYGVAIP
jgi:hypothetical protein